MQVTILICVLYLLVVCPLCAGNSADLCIVPIGEDVCSALQSSVFEELMSSLGLQPPDDTVCTT